MEQPGNLSRSAEIEAALQRSQGAGKVALIELEGTEAQEGEEKRSVEAYRFIFSIEGDAYVLLRVGTHDLLK